MMLPRYDIIVFIHIYSFLYFISLLSETYQTFILSKNYFRVFFWFLVFQSLLGTVAIAFTSGYACHSLPYEKGLSSKKLLWVLHNLLLGSSVAPLSVLGGPVMLHAAFYGTVVVWGRIFWGYNSVFFLIR